MRVGNISNTPSFRADLSKGMQRMIAKARQICTEEERPLLEDAVKTLKECCPGVTLATQKKATHVIVPSTQKGNLWGYVYGTCNSRNNGNAVHDVRNAAAGLEFMHIGGVAPFTPYGGKTRMVPKSMIKDTDGRFTDYYNKWIDFFKNDDLPPVKSHVYEKI